MLRFYGGDPPAPFDSLRLGGICPHCKEGTRYKLTTIPDTRSLRDDHIKLFVANYTCEVCLGPIPVQWTIGQWHDQKRFQVFNPKIVIPTREPFDFEHVPEAVKGDVGEALDCLSVSAYNGFAALCRRAVQSICTNLGATATTKVKSQIEEMVELINLEPGWKELAIQIMLSGHDGAHPHLPDVDASRAAVLLSLLRDLTYQLYTRPGKVKEAAQLRKQAQSSESTQQKK